MDQKKQEREARLERNAAKFPGKDGDQYRRALGRLRGVSKQDLRRATNRIVIASAVEMLTRAWPSPRIRCTVDYNYPETFEGGAGI